MIQNADQIKGKIGDNLNAALDQLDLFKTLVTIKCDVQTDSNFSDLIIGGHLTTLWVYSSVLIVFLIGFYMIKEQTIKNVMISSVVGSLVFFFVTNFGVWLIGYPNNLSGFIACYVAAIPFYKNTLLSALLYSGVIHSGYVYFSKNKLAIQDN